ncbi:putative membrane protein [uncultured Coleofasciculus sp.]|uniref:Putative membrane protein n=1 Tax=uncultured Coleofasciculus sp. TaxID=1267456 RepID=A0A6J4I761_9CYAN|nr:putative membrane protein [uncultured Coleofasciculus sp.]
MGYFGVWAIIFAESGLLMGFSYPEIACYLRQVLLLPKDF